MTILGISGLFIVITSLVLVSILVIYGRTQLHRMWVLFNFAVLTWGIGLFLVSRATLPSTALFGWRVAISGGLFIGVFFCHTVYMFAEIKKNRTLICIYAQAILYLFLTTLTTITLSGWKILFNSIYFPSATPAYLIMSASWVVVVFLGHKELIKFLRKSKGVNRLQARYLLIAFLIGFVGGGPTLLPPLGIPIYPFGNFGVAFYAIIGTYAILKYRLLEIEVFVKKTLVFAGLFTIVFGVFVGITLLTQELIAGGRLLGFAISSLVIIFMVRPLENILVRITDKYLFQKEYDRQQLLKELSQGIVGKIELEKLKSFLCSAISEKMKLENIIIIDEDNVLFNWHKENRMPLLYDTIDYSAKEKKDDVVGIKTRMKELRASLSIPIFLKNEIFWLLLFGNKKSGRIYSTEDINMLEALSHEISIAIENAVNFQELKLSQMELLRQENLKFVSVLVKGLAHEIFNPLMPLMHKIEDLEGEDLIKIYEIYEKNKSKLDKDDEMKFKSSLLSLRESTKSLKNNASHIHLIVDTLSKLEKGDEKTIGPVDIKSFFKEIVTLFGLEIEPNLQQGVVINQNTAQNLPPVKANPTLLKQIFINLYKNSCYAMKNSSSKTINIACEASKSNQNELKIEFSDTGSGISPDVLSKVFSYGFTTKGSKGSGIGLNQCKAIIERFGGTIIIESEKNKGTRVIIKVPIWEEEVKNVA